MVKPTVVEPNVKQGKSSEPSHEAAGLSWENKDDARKQNAANATMVALEQTEQRISVLNASGALTDEVAALFRLKVRSGVQGNGNKKNVIDDPLTLAEADATLSLLESLEKNGFTKDHVNLIATIGFASGGAAGIRKFTEESRGLSYDQLIKALEKRKEFIVSLYNLTDRFDTSIAGLFPIKDWVAEHNRKYKAYTAEQMKAPDFYRGGKTVPLNVIAVTSLVDASGEPGSDYVVAGGNRENRGAPAGSLFAGKVVEVKMNPNEYHKEKGQAGRGYGNRVTVRVPVYKNGDQIGEADMLYAHFDDVLVKAGEIVDVNQIIGTQGRTGSTTGAHVSLDIFAVNGNTGAQNELLRQMRARIKGK